MPLTDQHIRALVYLASECRPHGAPRWDEAGTFAAIAKIRHLHLADVALSVIRAADDEHAKTPGVIANTSAPNWQERKTDRPVPRRNWDRGEVCAECSLPEDRCRANQHSGHTYEPMRNHDQRAQAARETRST